MNNIASVWYRLVSFLIDILVFLFLLLLPILWLSSSVTFQEVFDRILVLVFLFFIVYSLSLPFINSFLISTFGGTLGKLLTGTRIVRENGAKISFWRAFFRNHIGYMISGALLWLGFIWIAIDQKRRGWHDQIADTYVVFSRRVLIWMGILAAFILILINLFLVIRSFQNFSENKSLYQGIVSEIVSELENNLF